MLTLNTKMIILWKMIALLFKSKAILMQSIDFSKSGGSPGDLLKHYT